MIHLKGFRSVFLTVTKVDLRVPWICNNNTIATGKLTAHISEIFSLFHVSYSNLFYLIIINIVFKGMFFRMYLDSFKYLCKLNLEVSLRRHDDKKVKMQRINF